MAVNQHTTGVPDARALADASHIAGGQDARVDAGMTTPHHGRPGRPWYGGLVQPHTSRGVQDARTGAEMTHHKTGALDDHTFGSATQHSAGVQDPRADTGMTHRSLTYQ